MCGMKSRLGKSVIDRNANPMRFADKVDRLALFYLIAILVSAFSSMLAAGLIQMDGLAGYSGWRWIYVRNFLAISICYG